ncbi:427_t:CDS:2 [Scutellospora calospora]|uniref:427_t:CDS:1 n=1 Tax=Scutellospora calospora TaxID=85575 RepID=A0ACA9L4J2_9GLOM|nr:427_t:CDS:2 [Scutellospora calospora]
MITEDMIANEPIVDGLKLEFNAVEVESFYLFQLNLNSHVQKYLNSQAINENDYEVVYKVNGRGQAICINDDEDFENFIIESKDLNSTKTMHLYINIKKSNTNK